MGSARGASPVPPKTGTKPMKRIIAAFSIAAAAAVTFGAAAAWSQDGSGAPAPKASIELHNIVTGEPLSFEDAQPEGRDTDAVKYFLKTGKNPYVEVASCLPHGKDIFSTACSGCHGHTGEGKIGPGLNDAYWTYPENTTDKGIFETVYGGASGQMGPQYGNLTLDEMLLATAWVRHFYTGDVSKADWLTDEQKKTFKTYNEDDHITPTSDTPDCKPALK